MTISSLTINALREIGTPPLTYYEQTLTEAYEAHPAPYGHASYANTYRAAARDPNWLAETLIANSLAEGDGSTRLRDLAAATATKTSQKSLKTHSRDEARHAKWYIAITELVFPGSIPAQLQIDLLSLTPFYNDAAFLELNDNSPFSHEVTLDDLIQMNIAEIRTRIHHLIQQPILLAYAPLQSKSKLKQLLNVLLKDETKHVAYTAMLIETMFKDYGVEESKHLFFKRIRDFNDITAQEVATVTFPSCAKCKGCAVPA